MWGSASQATRQCRVSESTPWPAMVGTIRKEPGGPSPRNAMYLQRPRACESFEALQPAPELWAWRWALQAQFPGLPSGWGETEQWIKRAALRAPSPLPAGRLGSGTIWPGCESRIRMPASCKGLEIRLAIHREGDQQQSEIISRILAFCPNEFVLASPSLQDCRMMRS